MAELGKSLIVPIDVAALCVGSKDRHGGSDDFTTANLAGIASTFSALPKKNSTNGTYFLSRAAVPAPFGSADSIDEGVHLHWALPDALTHGFSPAKPAPPKPEISTLAPSAGKVEFPAAPDRWLVVRMPMALLPAPPLAAWILESDRLWSERDNLAQNAMARAVPLDPVESGDSSILKGRAFRYADWPGETGPAVESQKHTAVGYGIADFAAAYPHCANVFGLYDDLDSIKLPAGTLCYAVIGWYSDLAKDPLHSFDFNGETDYDKKLKLLADRFKWAFPDDGVLPDRIICSGVLRAVPWNLQTKYLAPRAAQDVQVAIGNSTAEALAALLRHNVGGDATLESMLHYFQLGLLDQLGKPGGVHELGEAIHRAGFGGIAGGAICVLKAKDPAPPAEQHPSAFARLRARAAGDASPSSDIPALLNTLNTVQQSVDAWAADTDTRRSQIYFDWYRYMLLQYADKPDASPLSHDDVGDVMGLIVNQDIGDLNARSSGAPSTTQANNDLTTALGTLDLEAKPIGAPRYWQPVEPVVLLAGKDVEPPARYGGDGRADPEGKGRLVCRFAEGIVAALTVQGVNAYQVTAADLPCLPQPAPAAAASLPPEISPLLAEAFLIDADRAPLLAAIVERKCGSDVPTGSPDGLVQAIASAQQKLAADAALESGPVSFSGAAPSPIGVATWAQPWLPLILQWGASFTPVQAAGGTAGDYPADLIASQFRFDDNEIDLVANALPSPSASVAPYDGSAILTGRTAINLRTEIDKYLKLHPNDPEAGTLAKVRDHIAPWAMVQALSGFNQALLMRGQTLQLPVADPLAEQESDDDTKKTKMRTNEKVRPAVGGNRDQAPNPNAAFNPLRAGVLKISDLRIVDAFGQFLDLKDPAVIVAQSLQPPNGSSDGPISLPMRVAQPCRLLFRWLSASDDQAEMNAHPATSPVFGWVLFNHLDDNLMVFDAEGTALGSINPTYGDRWQGAPGAATFLKSLDKGFDCLIRQAPPPLASADRHLLAFVGGICDPRRSPEDFTGFVQALLAAIDAAMTTTVPAGHRHDQGLGLLVGQPLALVRASLRLELKGLPALDQSWAAFASALAAYRNNITDGASQETRPRAAFDKVRFPVRLGEASRLDDGLVGYFIEGDSGTPAANTYATFHALAPNYSNPHVVQAKPDDITLTPVASTNNANSLNVVMLIDPRGSVHATTGILPTKAIDLPGDMYSAALKRLAVTFLATPMVLPPNVEAAPGNPSSAAGVAFPVPPPDEPGYAWQWLTHRPGQGNPAEQWPLQPFLPAPGTKATFASPQRIVEGWLKLMQKRNGT